MAIEDGIVIAVVGVVIIEGLWLVALTWLMWRRKRETAAAPASAPPKVE